MNRRQLLALIGGAAAAQMGLPAFARAPAAASRPSPAASANGEMLYTATRLPTPWPPKLTEPLDTTIPPPYVTAPPAVIPIDVGRQLFVDDFLIERTDLTRTLHRPTPHPGNPIVRPDKPWEGAGTKRAMAMVFSDGVWFDPDERLFKMWYMGGYGRGVCYARSADGVRWEKPELDAVEKGTNLVNS